MWSHVCAVIMLVVCWFGSIATGTGTGAGVVYPTSCPFTETICRNGGFINTTRGDCEPWIECNLDPPYPHWFDTHPCQCPTGFSGVDCAVVAAPSAGGSCAPGLVWNGDYLVDSPASGVELERSVECFLDNSDANRVFAFREHRINITLHPASTTIDHITHITWDIISRHRNNSQQPPSFLCGPVHHDMHCDLSQCNPVSSAGPSVQYTWYVRK